MSIYSLLQLNLLILILIAYPSISLQIVILILMMFLMVFVNCVIKNLLAPDGLPGSFFFNMWLSICYPLFVIFNKSLITGIFPDIWKTSAVNPILKSGDPINVTNYRPISIISHLAKLFEAIVLRSIQPSINRIFLNEPHGVRPLRSTTTCNLVFTNFIMNALSMYSQFDVIYTDFAKAFDRVDHSKLLNALCESGFCGPLLTWFTSYQSNRKQFVRIKGTQSHTTNIHSGVPQEATCGLCCSVWLLIVFIKCYIMHAFLCFLMI